MMKKPFNVLDSVVNQDLCIGCGACLYQNKTSSWEMDWNKEGFLIPTLKNVEDQQNQPDLDVCPFNPHPSKEVRTEDELANIFLKDAPNYHSKVGRYFNTYVGYSEVFRLTSSSGGLATYIISQLFERGFIDAVITVAEGKSNHYEYTLLKDSQELLSTSKTRYYPVTMDKALQELKDFDGKIAVVGIGCFIKSVRLLQHYNPDLKEKIVFTVGIICGGMKSKFFGEYLAAKSGVIDNDFSKPEFRIKDLRSSAVDYSFGCVDKIGDEKQIKMQSVGDMWGSGMFKNNACDYCDDVTTELADISLGDAWIQPYNQDGGGTNVIVTRSKLAEELVLDGIKTNLLNVNELDFGIFLRSQQGSYNHRHNALNYRINKAQKMGVVIPPKRHFSTRIGFDFKLVQNQRRVVRRESLTLWADEKKLEIFEKIIKKSMKKLQTVTLIYHYKKLVYIKIRTFFK